MITLILGIVIGGYAGYNISKLTNTPEKWEEKLKNIFKESKSSNN